MLYLSLRKVFSPRQQVQKEFTNPLLELSLRRPDFYVTGLYWKILRMSKVQTTNHKTLIFWKKNNMCLVTQLLSYAEGNRLQRTMSFCIWYQTHRTLLIRLICSLAILVQMAFLVQNILWPAHTTTHMEITRWIFRIIYIFYSGYFQPCWTSLPCHLQGMLSLQNLLANWQMVSIHLRRGSQQVCPKVLVMFVNYFKYIYL